MWRRREAMVSRVTMVDRVQGTACSRPVHASQASHDLLVKETIKGFGMQYTPSVSRDRVRGCKHIWNRMCVNGCMYACACICKVFVSVCVSGRVYAGLLKLHGFL